MIINDCNINICLCIYTNIHIYYRYTMIYDFWVCVVCKRGRMKGCLERHNLIAFPHKIGRYSRCSKSRGHSDDDDGDDDDDDDDGEDGDDDDDHRLILPQIMLRNPWHSKGWSCCYLNKFTCSRIIRNPWRVLPSSLTSRPAWILYDGLTIHHSPFSQGFPLDDPGLMTHRIAAVLQKLEGSRVTWESRQVKLQQTWTQAPKPLTEAELVDPWRWQWVTQNAHKK